MDIDKREIYRAIAELAYVIAKAEKGLNAEERIAFFNIVEEELDYEGWAAQSRFEVLDEITHPTMEHAYNEAMFEFKTHKQKLTPELKAKTVKVLERIANAFGGTGDKESFVIGRIKHDLRQL